MKRILALILSISFCLSGCGLEKNPEVSAAAPETFSEFADIFQKYGVQGITPQLIEVLEQSYSDLPPDVVHRGAVLLTVLGEGSYDAETMTWTPSQNGVYAFDMEVLSPDRMYTDFLTGIRALDPEELAFANIQEDTSQVNWEEGTGKRTVSFEWQGEQFTLEAEAEHDWFDPNAAGELSEIIREHGNGKQLFFTGDGYQECIVFYRSQDWAEAFQAETGMGLTGLD